MRSHLQGGLARPAKSTLHIPPSRPGHKKKIHTTVEPLRGSDAPGDKATIRHIFAHFEPIRIKHDRRFAWAEEFLVRWEHVTYTFGEALEQYRWGFDRVSITSMENDIPSHSLQPFVSAKRLARTQRRALQRPPLTTRCIVPYTPFPQGPRHIRSIAGGVQALDTFLATEALSLPSLDTPAKVEPHSPLIKRRSSAQAPTRTKRGKHPSLPPPPQWREEPGTHPTSIPSSPTATTAQRPPPHCHGGGRSGQGFYPETRTLHLLGTT